ncbi:MAG: GNAT family N-acetyltransferase [Candidatus Hydrogenedentes bacterium]|nr:GNAT family N-acetyltransferase [Candidatus Hydrogenedentota bacterium]
MTPSNPFGAHREARNEDIPALLQLMRLFYAEDNYPFSETGASRALAEFLENPAYGVLLVAVVDDSIAGYVAVTFGFSFEYGGRDAFIDEIYVDAALRGRGYGEAQLQRAIAVCKSRGVQAVHLEVEPRKERTAQFYRRHGFSDHNRILMTRRLRSGPS